VYVRTHRVVLHRVEDGDGLSPMVLYGERMDRTFDAVCPAAVVS
jgi:hypothetical protein